MVHRVVTARRARRRSAVVQLAMPRCCTPVLYGTFRRLLVGTNMPSDLGALGGTRTPNLLIRRDLRAHPLPAHMLLTCRNATQRCAIAGSVERCCKAKIGPVRPRQTRLARRRLTVKSCLTVNAGLSGGAVSAGCAGRSRAPQRRRTSSGSDRGRSFRRRRRQIRARTWSTPSPGRRHGRGKPVR
jgi:hypothetical protein